MNATDIDYVDVSWNAYTGCSDELPCWGFCWARRMANRLRGRFGYDATEPFKPTFHPERLVEPWRIKKPKRIAVSFMGDLFNAAVPWQWQKDVLNTAFVAHKLRGHTFLFLTKRPQSMADTVRTWLKCADFGTFAPEVPDGFWLGTSVSNQADAELRIPELLKCPGNLWVSIEPMQGPVRIDKYLDPVMTRLRDPHVGWVVAGGGPFPVHPDNFRSVRDQCVAAGTPFWFKQWGAGDYGCALPGNVIYEAGYRVREKKGGDWLDGRQWHEEGVT